MPKPKEHIVYKRLISTMPLLLLLAVSLAAQPLAPISTRKLDGSTNGIAWLDASHVVTAAQSGVRVFSLPDGTWQDLISTKPVPDGLPDPISVATDGRSVIASNGFERTQFACRADTRNRLFARLSPLFMVIDVAVAGKQLYVLGWPADSQGANNTEGIAVWRGGLSPHFENFEPFHRIQSGTESIRVFNDSLPLYGGAIAIEPDGTVDIITAAEPGIFQYTAAGAFRRRLGANLGELVMRRMHDINFTFGDNPIARYREVVNRQPTADDLVVTPDGPAIVVRLSRGDFIEWELWYPNADRLDRRVKLGISRRGPFGHLACDARGHDLACVYQAPQTAQQAVAIDQTKVPSYLVQFTLPSYRSAGPAMATRR